MAPPTSVLSKSNLLPSTKVPFARGSVADSNPISKGIKCCVVLSSFKSLSPSSCIKNEPVVPTNPVALLLYAPPPVKVKASPTL